MSIAGQNNPLLAVVSPKGGVGKTTVVANLGAALAARGRPVVLIDLDPQNGLRLHHGMPFSSMSGLTVQSLSGQPWADALFRGPYGVEVLPFGGLEDRDLARFERRIADAPGWLAEGLRTLGLAPGTVMIADTPPGPNPFQRAALAEADQLLAVLLPDAASFATLPLLDRWLVDWQRLHGSAEHYLINRMNTARPLCRDVVQAMRARLGPKLLDIEIRFDAAVEEAIASQCPVQHYAPGSATAQDFDALADRLTRVL